MRLIMSDQEIDRADVLAAILGLAGLLWAAAAGILGFGAGILSAFAAIFAMATYGTLENYRVERGLWILAILITAFGAAMWALFVFSNVIPSWRGTRPQPWWLTIDVAGATALWAYSARLSLSVGVRNWRTFRE